MPLDPKARVGGEERGERECQNGNAKSAGTPWRLTNHLKCVLIAKKSVSFWTCRAISQIAAKQVLTQGWDSNVCSRGIFLQMASDQ